MANTLTRTEIQRAKVIPLHRPEESSREAVLRILKDRVLKKTDYLVSGLHVNASNALFEEMKSIGHQDKLAEHFNIMRSLKVGQTQYRTKFCQLLERSWDGFEDELVEAHVAKPIGEVSDWIDAYSARTANHYKVLLRELRGRFQTILRREIDQHPLMPELYYRAFWQSLAKLDLTYEERRYLLPLFHRFVMDRYGQIIGQVNRVLINLKVEVAT